MKKIKLTDDTKKGLLQALLKRSPGQYGAYEKTVTEIISRIREQGDQALFACTKEFDHFETNRSEERRVGKECL